MKKLLLALFVALSLAQPASAAEPLTWLKGGYGENIRSYEILKCASLPGHQSPNGRTPCPVNTVQIMRVTAYSPTSPTFAGDAKWYWEPIPVRRAYPTKGTYRLTFDYQSYTWGGELVAWYYFQTALIRITFHRIKW